jgi:hypothetical protein
VTPLSPALFELVAPPLAENKPFEPALPQAMASGSKAETQDTTAKPRTNFICAPKNYTRKRSRRVQGRKRPTLRVTFCLLLQATTLQNDGALS